jgi:histone acetyltransferase SAS3
MEVAPSPDEDEIQRQISSEHERAALEDTVKKNHGAAFTRPKFMGKLDVPEHAVEDDEEEDEDAEGEEDVEMREVGVGNGYDGVGGVDALPRRDSEYVADDNGSGEDEDEDEDEDADADGDSDDEMVDG